MHKANARLIGFLSKAVSRIENKQREHRQDKIVLLSYDAESDFSYVIFSYTRLCTCFMTPKRKHGNALPVTAYR